MAGTTKKTGAKKGGKKIVYTEPKGYFPQYALDILNGKKPAEKKPTDKKK